MKGLQYHWYTRSPWLLLLTPLSIAYRAVTALRRFAYKTGIVHSHKVAIPVIVVGNITVGGTGKTPLVAWLANYLKEQGYRPGIVSRGYGGKARSWPQQVRPDSDPAMVGDEAVMLAGQTQCPMAVAPKRTEAAEALIEHSDCNIILSDDGLQHYALQRDVEIAVIDGVRRFGSGFLLPAGPLREPVSRLKSVDMVVVNGLGNANEYQMKVKPGRAVSLNDAFIERDLTEFRGRAIHAVAGIGHPDRFFQLLQQAGIRVEEHAFPDHHPYRHSDVDFGDDKAIIMTRKDAVKCRSLGLENAWFVPITVEMPGNFCDHLRSLLDAKG